MSAEEVYAEDSLEDCIAEALEGRRSTCEVGPYVVAVELAEDSDGDYSYLEADPEREEEARRWFRKNGYSKQDSWRRARVQAQEDSRRLASLAAGDWWFVGIVATATFAGREVGYSSCWGYASDSVEYLPTEALGHVQEALRQARKAAPVFNMV